MRALVAAEWAARARAEREAEARFGDLADRLHARGALPQVVAMARAAVEDEARHAALCAQVSAQLGGAPCAEHAVEIRSFAPRVLDEVVLDERDRLLYEVVSFCCINESINAALLTVSLRRAQEPVITDALRAILKDEVAHARLGWAHLTAERAAGRGDFLAAAIPTMLTGAIRGDELILLARSSGDQEASAARLGHVSMNERVQLFAATLRDVVFPGLRRSGLATGPGESWLSSWLPTG